MSDQLNSRAVSDGEDRSFPRERANGRRAGAQRPSPYMVQSYASATRFFAYSAYRLTAIAVALVALVAGPALLSTYSLHVMNAMMLAVIGACGIQIVTGFAGQLSLGHAGFVAAGAFASGAVVIHFGLGFWPGLVAAVILGGLLGAIAGLPAFRLRWAYLAITTLAVQSIVLAGAQRYQLYVQRVYGVGTDLSLPTVVVFPGVEVRGVRQWYWVLLIGTGLVVLGTANLKRSRIGRGWRAVSSREVAVRPLGISVSRLKTYAFVWSGILGGVAGWLGGYYYRAVSVSNYDLFLSVEFVAMILIGGLATVTGAVLGAMVVVGLPFLIGNVIEAVMPSSGGLSSIIRAIELGIFAITMVIFLLVEPGGLAGLWVRIRSYFERWPYRYTER